VERRINGSLSSKLYGFEKLLSPLVARACISVCPKNAGNFNVDNVRVVKIAGGSVGDAQLVHGVVSMLLHLTILVGWGWGMMMGGWGGGGEASNCPSLARVYSMTVSGGHTRFGSWEAQSSCMVRQALACL